MKIANIALATALIALPAGLLAQTTPQERHDINGRRANEQSRIQQGKASGQLTNREANHLERNQHAIHREERADRAADGGHLTSQDRHQLARQQNAQSRAIYRDKHNARTQPGVPPAQ